MCFSPYLGIECTGGGNPKELQCTMVHSLPRHFFKLGSSKMKVFETCLDDIVAIQYDHPRYVKHVLGRIYVFFTVSGY